MNRGPAGGRSATAERFERRARRERDPLPVTLGVRANG